MYDKNSTIYGISGKLIRLYLVDVISLSAQSLLYNDYKAFMNKYIVLLLSLVLMNACTTDEDTPAFEIDDKDAQIVELKFTPDNNLSPFYYLVQADQMTINWGDGTLPVEYDYLGNDLSSIKPIQYTYKQAGNYAINIRMSKARKLDFSKGIDGKSLANTLESITLTNGITLKEFYCQNQTFKNISLLNCDVLEVANFVGSDFVSIDIQKVNTFNTFRVDSTAIPSLDCSYLTNVSELGIGAKGTDKQSISNTDLMKRLKRVYINGNLSNNVLDLTANDSVQRAFVDNSNLAEINLSNLKQVTLVNINKNAELKNLVLTDNVKLDSILLSQNSILDATALNKIFTSLPSTSDAKSKVIILTGNAGDATCDRTIATQKGWVFK